MLSKDEFLFFKKNGYVGPFTLYEKHEAENIHKRLRSQLFDRSYAVYDLPKDSALANYDRHLDISLLSRHVCRAEIVEKLKSILGNNVICWRSEFFPKYPGDEGTDWHQADTFAHASGAPQIVWPDNDEFNGTITVWTALTDSTEENGCLRFIPGTHTEMNYDESKEMKYDTGKNSNINKDGIKRGFFGYDYRSLQKDPDWSPDESKAVSLEMKAGQFIIFWSNLMHASLPNSTKSSMRLGYTSRYLPAKVKVYPGVDRIQEFGSEYSLEKYGVVFVSGKDKYKHNRVLLKNARGEPFSG